MKDKIRVAFIFRGNIEPTTKSLLDLFGLSIVIEHTQLASQGEVLILGFGTRNYYYPGKQFEVVQHEREAHTKRTDWRGNTGWNS